LARRSVDFFLILLHWSAAGKTDLQIQASKIF